jgi:hypothetical protein
MTDRTEIARARETVTGLLEARARDWPEQGSDEYIELVKAAADADVRRLVMDSLVTWVLSMFDRFRRDDVSLTDLIYTLAHEAARAEMRLLTGEGEDE